MRADRDARPLRQDWCTPLQHRPLAPAQKLFGAKREATFVIALIGLFLV